MKTTRPEAGITIAPEPPDTDDVARLLSANAALSATLYPADGDFALDPQAFARSGARLLVARDAFGVALGCVGLKLTEEDGVCWGEMKSFFVAPAARGMKLGLRLLAALESHATSYGVAIIRLETGPLNPAAITLYGRAGYVERPPFGAYVAGPYSLFMEKTLDGGG